MTPNTLQGLITDAIQAEMDNRVESLFEDLFTVIPAIQRNNKDLMKKYFNCEVQTSLAKMTNERNRYCLDLHMEFKREI